MESGKPKEYHIIVNARPKTVTEDELSFEQVIKLAYDQPPTGPDVIFTVVYEKGKHEGSLVPGQKVKIENGMNFRVKFTNKS
jgi:hypothetical protein